MALVSVIQMVVLPPVPKICNSSFSQRYPLNNADDGYRLGLRVYRADAFNDNTPLKGNVPAGSKVKQATFRGLGNRKAPLIETTTEILSLIELPIELLQSSWLLMILTLIVIC